MGARSGWERKRENWMGKCLGEKKLNKRAASGIHGLEIRWTAAYRQKQRFLHITLYTVTVTTAIIHGPNHSRGIYGIIICGYIK